MNFNTSHIGYDYHNNFDIEAHFINKSLSHTQLFIALEAIKRCHETSGTAFTRGMLLTGPTSVGKSITINTYSRNYLPTESNEGFHLPILRVDVPDNGTKEGLLSQMLMLMGDPNPFSGKHNALYYRVRKLIKALGVELIVFDDIHLTLPEYTYRKTQSMADLIRILIRQSQCPIILVGLECSSRIISDGNKGKISQDQLSSRLRKGVNIKPFSPYDEDWIAILKGFMKIIPHDCIDLSKESIRNRLYLATHGTIGFLANILKEACYFVQNNKITKRELSLGFEECQAISDYPYNPFELTDHQVRQFLNEVMI